MKIDYVTNDDDWVGLYINGKLIDQNHSLSLVGALRAVIERTDHELETHLVDWDWLDSQGYLPENLEDVVFQEG